MGVCVSGGTKKKSENEYIKEKYIYGRTLGKGGSCRVVEVESRANSIKYALKIMTKKDKMNKDLYDKEKEILNLLDHTNIIHLHESTVDEQHYYIITELCNGGELFDRIVDKTRPITEKRASQLVQTMLKAIDHCHKRNIVHRDLKPENFVFKDDSPNSEMVLIDFGCAKIVQDDQAYKDLVGTPYYLAPESAAGHKYTRTGKVLKASDVWSIGVIAYVLMTGRPPFNGHSNVEIFASIIKKQLKFPAHVKLSKGFVDFVKKMLKKSPKQRMALQDALKHNWVSGETASNQELSSDVIKVLRQFNQQSKLKKAITRTLAAHMGKEPQAKIKEHFKRLDKDNSGGLDSGELALLLQDMGITKVEAESESKRIISEVDDDGSGEIEFEEFATIWQRKLLSVNESYIHAVFTVLDENGDGDIDAAELGKVLEVKDKQKIASYIKEVDTNEDGKISFPEFRIAMLELKNEKQNMMNTVGHKMNKTDFEKEVDVGVEHLHEE